MRFRWQRTLASACGDAAANLTAHRYRGRCRTGLVLPNGLQLPTCPCGRSVVPEGSGYRRMCSAGAASVGRIGMFSLSVIQRLVDLGRRSTSIDIRPDILGRRLTVCFAESI